MLRLGSMLLLEILEYIRMTLYFKFILLCHSCPLVLSVLFLTRLLLSYLFVVLRAIERFGTTGCLKARWFLITAQKQLQSPSPTFPQVLDSPDNPTTKKWLISIF